MLLRVPASSLRLLSIEGVCVPMNKITKLAFQYVHINEYTLGFQMEMQNVASVESDRSMSLQNMKLTEQRWWWFETF